MTNRIEIRNKQKSTFGRDYTPGVTYDAWELRDDGWYYVGGGKVYGRNITDQQCIDNFMQQDIED